MVKYCDGEEIEGGKVRYIEGGAIYEQFSRNSSISLLSSAGRQRARTGVLQGAAPGQGREEDYEDQEDQ